jgi:hypothetical protein
MGEIDWNEVGKALLRDVHSYIFLTFYWDWQIMTSHRKEGVYQ